MNPSKWNKDFFGNPPGQFDSLPVEEFAPILLKHVSIIYGTGAAPANISGYPEGCIYLQHSA